MVTKMTKYSFILLGEETEKFLLELQGMGILDITRSRKPVDGTSAAYLDRADKDKKALHFIEMAVEDAAKGKSAVANTAKVEGDPTTVVLNAHSRIDELKNEIRNLDKVRKDRLVWGGFNKESLMGLGLDIRFYSVPVKKYDPEWEQQYAIQIVSQDKNNVWFVTVAEKGEPYDFPYAELNTPDGSYEDTEAAIAADKEEIATLQNVILAAADCVPAIEADYGVQMTDLDRYLAGVVMEPAAEDKLNVFVGFAPTSSDAELCAKLNEMGVFYMTEAATVEDNPPIKLKNNKFIRMFEVFTNMYGMPVYNEFDPTVILGPFYLLFWSLCMGDAGYGILLVLIGFFLKRMKSMASLSSLVVTLGVGTFIVGLFLATFFGMNLLEVSWIPDWAKSCMLQGEIMGYSTAMVLSILIGVVHICLAMVIKTAVFTKRFGFMHCISTWGWTLLIVGGVLVAAAAMLFNLDKSITKIIVIVLGSISALGIFIFNNPKRNPLINIGAGLWDTYNMATGLLGDTLSYVRLYALGLAGGMLGNAFNDLSHMVMGDHITVYGVIFCVIILLIGHALNLVMSVLGAFVHPLRLTFVEFFKNSGFSGAGRNYNPLAVRTKE
ncbi:MAG: ATPase V [Bacteroidales bacterium]|nr:ATPase V [Bacteroidales bacterium]